MTPQNIFKHVFKGTALENVALSAEGATIEASIPTFLEGSKDVFGVRLSDRDLAVLLNKIVDLGKSPETNFAILDFADKFYDLSIKKAQIADEIVKANGDYVPIGFQRKVNEEFDRRYGDEIDQAYNQVLNTPSPGQTPTKSLNLLPSANQGKPLSEEENRKNQLNQIINGR